MSSKKYRLENKEKIARQRAACHQRNKVKFNEASRLAKEKYLREWAEHIELADKCEICGAKIEFASGNQRNSIHFDHKEPNDIIGKRPTGWLATNRWSKEKEKIWRSCDFGFLCYRCNKYLPTENRKEFIKMSFKYIFGKEMEL